MEDGIGRLVREKRLELGLSQTALAEASGLSKGHLSTLEAGKIALPAPDIRRRLAAALGVSHLDLLVAAGEITEDEIKKAGAEGVVEEDPDPLRAQLVDVVRQVRWAEKPELAHSLITVAMGILKDQQTAPARRPASSAPGR